MNGTSHDSLMGRTWQDKRLPKRALHELFTQNLSIFCGSYDSVFANLAKDVVLSGLAFSIPMSQAAKSVSELAALIGSRVIGDPEAKIQRVASLESAGEGDIAYVEDEKFFEAAKQSR